MGMAESGDVRIEPDLAPGVSRKLCAVCHAALEGLSFHFQNGRRTPWFYRLPYWDSI